jgi:hypothetical protein
MSELLAAIYSAAGLEPLPNETDGTGAMRLHGALRGRHRPLLVAIDGLDEAIDPEGAVHTLVELYRAGDDLPLRILVSTRQQPLPGLALVRALAVSVGTRQDVVESVRDRLVAVSGSTSPEIADQTAEVIADISGGHFLTTLMAGSVVSGSLPSEPAALAERLRKAQSQPPVDASPRVAIVRATLERWLDSLGDQKPDALELLTALARGPARGMTAEEWLAAASRPGNRAYQKADLDLLSRRGVIGRPRDDGTYLLHDLVRAFVLEYQDYGTQIPPQSARE